MEIITFYKYKELADYIIDNENFIIPKNMSVVYCDNEIVVKFFELIENTNNEYILITGSASDHCLCEQASYSIIDDTVDFCKTKKIDLDHNNVLNNFRCNTNKCRYEDLYSIKNTTYTEETFNKIPKNIKKWFCVNSNIYNETVEPIPIGIYEKNKEYLLNQMAIQNEKKYNIYYNMTNNYYKRNYLFNIYKELENENIIVHNGTYPHVNKNGYFYITDNYIRNIEDYYKDVSMSYSQVTMSGAGYDSLRILESIYLQCFPIFLDYHNFQIAYNGLSYIRLNNVYINHSLINRHYNFNFNLENTRADFNYWKKRVYDLNQKYFN